MHSLPLQSCLPQAYVSLFQRWSEHMLVIRPDAAVLQAARAHHRVAAAELPSEGPAKAAAELAVTDRGASAIVPQANGDIKVEAVTQKASEEATAAQPVPTVAPAADATELEATTGKYLSLPALTLHCRLTGQLKQRRLPVTQKQQPRASTCSSLTTLGRLLQPLKRSILPPFAVLSAGQAYSDCPVAVYTPLQHYGNSSGDLNSAGPASSTVTLPAAEQAHAQPQMLNEVVPAANASKALAAPPAIDGILQKDAFLVFRALCKLSVRSSETATGTDPTAVRGKVRATAT